MARERSKLAEFPGGSGVAELIGPREADRPSSAKVASRKDGKGVESNSALYVGGDCTDVYNRAPDGGRVSVLSAWYDDDKDIERAGNEYGTARFWTEDRTRHLIARWKAAAFFDLTGFDVRFPLDLSLGGAMEFVEISIRNQWIRRGGKRTSGVDVFLEEKFGHILANNSVPVSLIGCTDADLYDRILHAHAIKSPLPGSLIYDVAKGNVKRPPARIASSGLRRCGALG